MTPELLRAATGCSAANAQLFAAHISEACALYDINTPARLAAFLAQIGHESGSLQYVREVWGPTAEQLRYEGRKDLGNLFTGDGVRYRGRGLIQTTGRYNYRSVSARLRERVPDCPDFEVYPDKLEAPRWAALSAADFWDREGINALADIGDVVGIGRLINRGRANSPLPANGEADRLRRQEQATLAIAAAAPAPESPAPESPAPAPADTPPTLQPPPQPKRRTMPFPMILAALLPQLVTLIPALGKLFGSGSAVAERNVKAATLAVQVVQEAVGARNAQEAIETIAADPAALQRAAQAVETRWFEIQEAGGGGIDGARKASAASSELGLKAFASPVFVVTVLLLPLVYMALYAVLYRSGFSDEVKAMVLGAIFGGLLTGGIQAFFYGTSASSQRKTEVMAERGLS